ncbi:bifunctional acetate--CoA ligase family protein/GNAT family N-acetyltransferase [Trinickia violacea]|nr:GNAT family N-acetyltransferase [Trinickia violacea]
MTVRNLDALFAPMSVIRLGASPASASDASGELRGGGQALQTTSFPALGIVRTPPGDWDEAIARAGAAGVRAVLLEHAAADGGAVEPALDGTLEVARSFGLRVLGPGDAGLAVPRAGVLAGCLDAVTFAKPENGAIVHGRVAWVSQSGDLACRMLRFAKARQLGVSVAVALGDEADVDCADVLDYLADDAYTSAVVIAIDHVKEARKFMSAAQACVKNKPVVVWCEPTADEDPRAYDAAIERAGWVRVASVDELLDAFATLQSGSVSSSAPIAAYRAACERLAQTPLALPAHRAELAEARAYVESLGGVHANAVAVMPATEAERLLAYFDLPCEDSDDSQAHDAPLDSDDRPSLAIRMRDDRTFGPHLTLAAGTEVVSLLLPLHAGLAHDALGQLASACDWRTLDVARLAGALASLSQMLCGIPRIVSFEAQVRVEPHGVFFARTSIRIGAAGTRRAPAIRPYPVELEETLEWRGHTLTIRPIRPEDEAAHTEFFVALTPEDVRLRFFHFVHAVNHSQVARYVQIDYEREMALIACTKDGVGGTVVHGVVRALTDPDNEAAEFAVTVRSDEKGGHLGRALVDRIIRYCRSRGTHRLFGHVLRENDRMLALARDCGFVIDATEDPDVMAIRLTLEHA